MTLTHYFARLDVTLDHVDPNRSAGEIALLVRLRVSALPTTGEAPRWPTSATAHGGHVSVRLRPVALGLGHGLIETLQTPNRPVLHLRWPLH